MFDYLLSFEALKVVRSIILRTINCLGFNHLFRLLNRKKMIILFFHGISIKSFKFTHKRYFPISTFIKIILYLKKKKYKFITLTEWIKIVKNNQKIKHRYVILTFDDGFKNVVDNAYPIIKKYNAKGCLYVISGIIGNNQLIWADYLDVLIRDIKDKKFKFKFKDREIEYDLASPVNIKNAIGDIKHKLRYMNIKERQNHLKQFQKSNDIDNFQNVPNDSLIVNWDELKSLDRQILEIGAHTNNHPNLKLLYTEDEFLDELYHSKLVLEKNLGYRIDHLSYPAGFYDKRTIQYAKKYNYKTATTVNYGFNTKKTDLFQLNRIFIDNDFTLFKFRISGLYHYMKKKINKYYL